MSPSWQLRVAGPASRKIAESMPEAVAAAVVEFVTGGLLENSERVGKPLRQQLTGLHVARRSTFRVVYRIIERERVVEVIDVGHRRDIYRRRT